MRYKHYPNRDRSNLSKPFPTLGPKELDPKPKLDPVMGEPDTRLKGFKPASFWK